MTRFLADAGFRVLAPSRPGYLESPLTDAVADPAGQADLYVGLLDALGVEQVDLVCWSGGGPSSYQLAIRHPERVRSMVALAALSGPYAFEHPSEETALFTRPGAWLMRMAARHAPKATVKMMTTEEGDLSKEDAKALVAAVWDDEAKRQWVLDWVGTVTGDRRTGFDNDRHHFADLDLDLASVRAPVLLVHADTDGDVPVDHSRRAAEALPDATLHTIEGGTHISVWTGPDDDAVRARILDHLG